VYAPRLAALMIASLAAGCAHERLKLFSKTVVFSDERSAECAGPAMGNMSPYRLPLSEPVTKPEDTAYLADVPPEVRRTAGAAGIEPLLVALLRLRDHERGEATPKRLSLELELGMRLAAFARQLEAVGFEVHCAAGQIQEQLTDLEHRDRHRQFKLAISSLIAGAVAASAAGAVTLARPDDARTPAIISIGGGLVTAGLGTLAVVNGDSKIVLAHDPNLLAPVFDGADPEHLFPTFVFRMLTYADRGPLGSPRARLLEGWNDDLDDVAVPRAEANRLLHGRGGAYTPELAEARLGHLERLESTLQSIARDLELLNRFIVRTLFGPVSSSFSDAHGAGGSAIACSAPPTVSTSLRPGAMARPSPLPSRARGKSSDHTTWSSPPTATTVARVIGSKLPSVVFATT
jgi:hypothetical protein